MKYEFEKKKLISMINKTTYELMQQYNAVIAGGTITSLFTRKEVNDFDIYFHTKKDMAGFVEEAIEHGDWIVAYTNKAVLFSINNQEYQAITFKEFSTIEELFETFDFTVCMGAFDCSKEEFVLHEDFMQHNAQKILKFNQKTAFPIISALRVDKYKKKGYYISKMDFVSIVLACMNLKLDSVEELKEHMGGMYGYNLDKVIDNDEDFDIVSIIEKLSSIEVSDEYFNMPKAKESFDLELIPLEIMGVENLTFVKDDDEFYAVSPKGMLLPFEKEPTRFKEVLSAEDYFKDFKCYKFVRQQEDGRLFSYHDKNFEYVVGEQVVPKGTSWGYSEPVLHVGNITACRSFTYSHKPDCVLIELSVESPKYISDYCEIDTTFGIKKGKVERIVPLEEYEKYMEQRLKIKAVGALDILG